MPIHIDFFHPARQAIVAVRGPITAEEVQEAIKQFLASGALHYSKIIDISATTAPLDSAAVEAIAARLRAQPPPGKIGPLAFLVRPGTKAAENAELFARLTEGERPVKVFQSLHAARKWLEENKL